MPYEQRALNNLTMPVGIGTYTDSSTNMTSWLEWNQTIEGQITQQIWSTWTVTGASSLPEMHIQGIYPALTSEERARLEAERQRAMAQAEEHQRAYEAAATRAEALLREHLDAEQQGQLERDQAFLVSLTTGRRYRIQRGQQGNVFELDAQGRRVRKFCIHPDLSIPVADSMLAQKLMLEHDEVSFRMIANITEMAA